MSLLLVLLSALLNAQEPSILSYQHIFHNRYVTVFRLELPSLRQAPIHQAPDDLVWIALDSSRIEVKHSDGVVQELDLRNGDVRLFRRWDLVSVTNLSAEPIHSVVVDLKLTGLTSSGCTCTVEVQKSICGCSAAHLPEFWAEVTGNLTMAGATLGPEQTFFAETNRDDSLLVTLTPAHFQHQFNLGEQSEWVLTQALEKNLQPGEVIWMPRGKHRLRNIGRKETRYIIIEFSPQPGSTD